MRRTVLVAHIGPTGARAERVYDDLALAQDARVRKPRDYWDVFAADLCPDSARPFATGGMVTPGSIPFINGGQGPELAVLPDGRQIHNREALRAEAALAVPQPGLHWADCPCGGIVAWVRDDPRRAFTYAHLDATAALRHSRIEDRLLVASGIGRGELHCPLAFLDALPPHLARNTAPPAPPAARLVCTIEYADGERATTTVTAADRPAVEAALLAAGVAFTLRPEGAP